jgi:hypothetical protein
MPWIFDEPVWEFQPAIFDNGWITSSFDWSEWQGTAQEFMQSPSKRRRLRSVKSMNRQFCDGVYQRA